jgi:hypothetical protein
MLENEQYLRRQAGDEGWVADEGLPFETEEGERAPMFVERRWNEKGEYVGGDGKQAEKNRLMKDERQTAGVVGGMAKAQIAAASEARTSRRLVNKAWGLRLPEVFSDKRRSSNGK